MSGLLIYKVFYKQYDNPIELQTWLDSMYVEENLKLVTMNDNYFVFIDAKKGNQLSEQK